MNHLNLSIQPVRAQKYNCVPRSSVAADIERGVDGDAIIVEIEID